MRKFALVAAMVLVSVGAQAGQSRGLSLAGSDKSVQETKAVEPANAVDAPRAPRAAVAGPVRLLRLVSSQQEATP